MRDVYSLPQNELIDLYLASMKHCANVVLTNVDGGDDSQDYVESAVEIMERLNSAYRDPSNSDSYVGLRDAFRKIVPTAYAYLASDAIPVEWDAFIDNKDM
jgi:hypothetical protein